MSNINIEKLSKELKELMENEQYNCKNTDKPYFVGMHVGKYEAYENILRMLNDYC